MHGDGKSGIPSLFIGSETIMKTNLVQYLHMLCLDCRTRSPLLPDKGWYDRVDLLGYVSWLWYDMLLSSQGGSSADFYTRSGPGR